MPSLAWLAAVTFSGVAGALVAKAIGDTMEMPLGPRIFIAACAGFAISSFAFWAVPAP